MKSKKILKIAKWRIHNKGTFAFSVIWLSGVSLLFSLIFSSLIDSAELAEDLLILIPTAIIFLGAGLVILFLSISRRYTFFEDKMTFYAQASSRYRTGSTLIYKVERNYADVVVMERETSKDKNGEKVELLKVLVEGDNLTLTLKYEDPLVQKIYKCYKECRNEVDNDDPFANYSTTY
jgi:hypothetical protein